MVIFRSLLLVFTSTLLAILTGGCGNSGSKTAKIENDTIITDAEYLSIVEHDNFTEVIIANPWGDGEILAHYALVDSSDANIPSGVTVLNVPLQRSVVYSSVHTSAIDELGAIKRIAGVADANYFATDNPISPMLATGEITDVGQSVSPSIEKIINLNADALLLSPWENANLGGVERSGVPLIMMADYLENTPLGRAEWIKLIGRLYGESSKADSIFNAVKLEYNNLKSLALCDKSPQPTVLTEKPYSGTWYVPGGQSYIANMLADAGAIYPWADNKSTGSLPLDEASVIDRAGDAQFWLVKDDTNHSDKTFSAMLPHAKAFRSFPDGVYICNTATTPIFLDIAFHPERILADFVKIFHPDAMTDKQLRYYKPLSE